MRGRFIKGALYQAPLVAALWLTGAPASAQQLCLPPSSPGCAPAPGAPYIPDTRGPGIGTGTEPGRTGEGAGISEGTGTSTDMTGASGTGESFGDLASGAGVGSSAALAGPGGYIDNAIPMNMFRLRSDSQFDINRPDRAEFFYATWRELSFHPHGIRNDGIYFDPKARGPQQLPGRLDNEEVSAYLELAASNRLSAFVEVPVRFLHFRDIQEEPDREVMPNGRFFPEPRDENTRPPNNTPGGLSDIQFGFKGALIADPNNYLTFQFRTYVPTGDAGQGLGTGHPSLEPGLLWLQRWTDRLFFQGQFRDWIPLGGGRDAFTGRRFAGNVLVYGLGLGYTVYQRCNLIVVPITEVVGWTVLDGLQSVSGFIPSTPPPGLAVPQFHGAADAAGNTIINAKLGIRTYLGQRHSFYTGWGHTLTGDHWYKNDYRVEYRFTF